MGNELARAVRNRTEVFSLQDRTRCKLLFKLVLLTCETVHNRFPCTRFRFSSEIFSCVQKLTSRMLLIPLVGCLHDISWIESLDKIQINSELLFSKSSLCSRVPGGVQNDHDRLFKSQENSSAHRSLITREIQVLALTHVGRSRHEDRLSSVGMPTCYVVFEVAGYGVCGSTLCGTLRRHVFLRGAFFSDMKRVKEISTQLIQRINVQFCQKIGITKPDTVTIIRACYGRSALSPSRIRFWFNQFQNGRHVVVDLHRQPRARSGRSPQNIAAVHQALQGDRRLSVTALAEMTKVPRTTVFNILKQDLQLVCKTAKFVPFLLDDYHRKERFEIAQKMLLYMQSKPNFLEHVITMDESWVYQYDPELKTQSSQWLGKADSRPVKCLRTRAVGKVMLVSFFDHKGVVHQEFIHGSVNRNVFCDILSNLRYAVAKRRPRIFKTFLLHMDNASCHTAQDTRGFLMLSRTKVLPHPAHSPDLAPSDFWFFPKLKLHLRGKRFVNLRVLEDAVDKEIAKIPSHEFANCILKTWPKRWARCVFSNGGYFEGIQ